MLVDTNQVDVQSTVNADTDADLEIGQAIKSRGGHNSNVPSQYIYLNYRQNNKQEPPTTSYKESRPELCATRLESPFTDRFEKNSRLIGSQAKSIHFSLDIQNEIKLLPSNQNDLFNPSTLSNPTKNMFC